MELNYYSESGIPLIYGTEDSAGLDLPIWDARIARTYVDAIERGVPEDQAEALVKEEELREATLTLLPGQAYTIKTGIYMAIEKGKYGLLDTRSSTSKIKLDLLCHTIDSDYRGNIRLALINLNSEPVTIKNGQSVAQIIIKEYVKAEPKASLDHETFMLLAEETERGALGFGSTGRNV